MERTFEDFLDAKANQTIAITFLLVCGLLLVVGIMRVVQGKGRGTGVDPRIGTGVCALCLIELSLTYYSAVKTGNYALIELSRNLTELVLVTLFLAWVVTWLAKCGGDDPIARGGAALSEGLVEPVNLGPFVGLFSLGSLAGSVHIGPKWLGYRIRWLVPYYLASLINGAANVAAIQIGYATNPAYLLPMSAMMWITFGIFCVNFVALNQALNAHPQLAETRAPSLYRYVLFFECLFFATTDGIMPLLFPFPHYTTVKTIALFSVYLSPLFAIYTSYTAIYITHLVKPPAKRIDTLAAYPPQKISSPSALAEQKLDVSPFGEEAGTEDLLVQQNQQAAARDRAAAV